ncbi:zinc finger protein [Macleaya cordata]|uniref:Zinc finger protein n=1 Tax=Macleaya cordata TaxID=56857 RepID=A0A200Q4K1_MACCD|nr:zinc finger protein [Macleaya cordata]
MDDNKAEPVRELGLGNQSTRIGLNNDSGAGANAGSRAEMIFVSSTPVTELVWSPHNGVSLKCADCSLPDKRFSFLCGVESNNMALSPLQSISGRETKDDVHVDEEKLSSSQFRSPRSTTGIIPVCRTTSHDHNLGLSGGMEGRTNKIKLSALNIDQEGDHSDKKAKEICHQTEKDYMPDPDNERSADSSSIKMDKPKFDLARIEPECRDLKLGTCSDPIEVNKDVCNGNSQTAGKQVALSSEVSTAKQCKLSDAQNPLITSHGSEKEELAPGIEKDDKNKKNKMGFNPPLGNQEFTAENDLQLLKGESACAEGGIIASQPADEGKQCSYQNGVILPFTEVPAVDASPRSSKVILSRRKDKEKVPFDEELNEKILKDEDDSHESVESCNSTGLFSAGKRKWNFGQQLIVDSKKMKQKHHESPHFGSLHKQDSSFMNWISNMIKGLSNSGPDDSPSLALTMRTHHGNQSNETNTGFQTIFKALYCPSSRVQEDKILTLDNQPGEGSKELELANIVYDNNSSPSTGDENGKCKQIVLSNEKFNQRISAEENSAKNRNLCNMAYSLKKGGIISSNSSLRNDSDFPSEGKEACKPGSINPNNSINNVTNRSNSLGNLWITRFSPKVSGLMINSPKFHENVISPAEGPIDRTKVLSRAQNCVVSRKDKNVVEDSCKPSMEDSIGTSKNVHNYVFNTNGSFGFKRRELTDQKKSESKLNTVNHSQRFKNSEALASVFARRLDALRHIIRSEVDGSTTHSMTTCFFCGIKGHKLQDCSEITGSEIDDLLKKINQCDEKEESSCLCIRCSQLNHWAIACPYSSSRRESNSDGSASLVNLSSVGKMNHIPGNDTPTNNDTRSPSENKDFLCQTALTTNDGKNPQVETEVKVGTNVNARMSRTMILDERAPDLKPAERDLLVNDFCDETAGKEFILHGKQSASGSTENVSKENQITAFCNFVHRHIPAVPRGTFEAVKRLRLSRADILKWIKSPMSLHCIDGFFLRLRLRKWDEGLGGTGYFVACVNGTPAERSLGSHKHPVSVDIAGFKCLIESRFVSNHDYTEDELMAWWCATLRGGGQMPSEEDLKMKFEEKKKLGF